LVKNILYIFGSVILFFAGMICYGIVLNLQEVSLKEAMAQRGISEIKDPQLVVDRKNFQVRLYSKSAFIKTYKAAFGKVTGDVKSSKNDNVTPLGEYRICSVDTLSRFHKFLKINYPNIHDAAEAYTRNYITRDEYEAILVASRKDECSPLETSLGAEIGIHGIGTYDIIFRNLPFSFNWTNGSIAVSNKSIDEIYSVVKIGTPVKITY
jgi:murein L,D-transpeptidase YafK